MDKIPKKAIGKKKFDAMFQPDSFEFRYELDNFKTNINLSELAVTFGYSLDSRETSRNTALMRDGSGDKICISRNAKNGHWMYWNVRNQNDSGSIIDFVQHRLGGSIGDVRRYLRSWTGGVEPKLFVHNLKPSLPDIQMVLSKYARTKPAPNHPYLLKERQIPSSTLHHDKFFGRVRIDSHGNAIFPHFDENGICGYEIKNTRFTGFSPQGRRGLWCSIVTSSDNRLIITESAIDALSFHALHGTEFDLYVSLGGRLGKEQKRLILKAIKKISSGSTILIATDRDKAGDSYSNMIGIIFDEAKRQDVTRSRCYPKNKDWNDDLKLK